MKNDLFRKTIVIAAVFASVTIAAPGSGPFPSLDRVFAQDDWKKEFDDICAKTGDAASFGAQELKDLIGRCDALKLRIEKLEEPRRKVALKRLQMCRDLFVYILQSKERN